MEIDSAISNWILDFLLGQPLEDRTLCSLLRILPLPENKSNLKVSLLLQKLQYDVSRGSISEEDLEILEQLEELLCWGGSGEVSEAMKHAYCAVAVECTVKYLTSGSGGENGKRFFEAVKRLWRGRVARMEKLAEKGGLLSIELLGWKGEMEAAVWEDIAADSVVKRSKIINAVEAMSTCIRVERERLGPFFIQLASNRLKDDEVLEEVHGVGKYDEVAEKHETCHSAGPRTDAQKLREEVQKQNFHPRSKLARFNRSRGVKIMDSDEISTASCRDRKSPLSAKVSGVRDGPESSSLEHQAVVKDSLLDALHLTESAGKALNHGNVELNHVVDKHLDVDGAVVAQSFGNTGNNMHRQKWMEPNISAQTFEWDDSIDDGSREISASHCGRQKLLNPRPRNIRVPPLRKCEITSFKSRRKARKWSLLEEDTLRTGVEKFGKGNWKTILTVYHDVFEDRTEVDLKDKWRNLMRY